MRSFDAPSREECAVDRPRSNNSLQALVLLNDPSFVEAARALALRTLSEGGSSVESRIGFIFQICLSRAPRSEEIVVLKEVLAEQRKQFAESPDKLKQFLSIGQAAVPDRIDSLQLATWASVARVILNLDEVITRT